MTDREMREYHWRFGQHSGIPDCCIEFFTEQWDIGNWWSRKEAAYVQAVSVAHFGYIPCPTCLGTNNRVKLKICLVECGREHREDFVPKEATDGYRSDTHKQLHLSDGV